METSYNKNRRNSTNFKSGSTDRRTLPTGMLHISYLHKYCIFQNLLPSTPQDLPQGAQAILDLDSPHPSAVNHERTISSSKDLTG